MKEVPALLQAAYDAGFDCALNGANTENCNFTFFATPELTAEWERGKKDGSQDRFNEYRQITVPILARKRSRE